jgi:FMN phosphatase YigB (HAD superfamily)
MAGTASGPAGRPVRLVLFDLGGTFWQHNKVEWRRLEAVAHRRAGAMVRRLAPTRFATFGDRTLGRHLHEHLERQRRVLVEREPTLEPDGPSTMERVLADWDLHVAASGALFRALDLPLRPSRVLFDDVLPALAALRRRGLTLGVVTNRFWGGPAFVEGMRALGLLEYFDPDKMAVSADLGVMKPAADIFRHALRAHGAAPEETAMVGNSLVADVLGAQRMGMLAVWKPEAQVLRLARAYLERHALSVERYNAGARPRPIRGGAVAGISAERRGVGGRALRPLLRGEVSPDLIVEGACDLPGLLRPPGSGPRRSSPAAAGRFWGRP